MHAALVAAGRSARGWLCQGWKRRGGAKACWHVTSAEISELSFPKLGAMLAAKADHAVAFHGWTAERIGVGGGAVDRAAHPERHRRHEALKEEVRAGIEAALPCTSRWSRTTRSTSSRTSGCATPSRDERRPWRSSASAGRVCFR